MRKLEPGEVIVYDDPRTMCMVVKNSSSEVSISYDLFFGLQKIIEAELMRQVNEHIKALADDCRGN